MLPRRCLASLSASAALRGVSAGTPQRRHPVDVRLSGMPSTLSARTPITRVLWQNRGALQAPPRAVGPDGLVLRARFTGHAFGC